MNHGDEFKKYAVKHKGFNSIKLDNFVSSVYGNYISPTIIEERQMNVAQMDVFYLQMVIRTSHQALLLRKWILILSLPI